MKYDITNYFTSNTYFIIEETNGSSYYIYDLMSVEEERFWYLNKSTAEV